MFQRIYKKLMRFTAQRVHTAKPVQAKPAQAEIKPAQVEAKPAQAKPAKAKPAQVKPAQAKPAQIKSEPERITALTGTAPDCPACGTPATHHSDYPSRVQPFAPKRVLYCSTCGLGFVPDMSEVLAEFYKRDYANANRGDRDVEPAQYFQAMAGGKLVKYTARVQRQIDLLKKFEASFDTVLDYGSGPGYFLHACGAGQAHAVEPDELSHKYLHHLGATIHADVTHLPKAGYDTIVASHAIEHLPAEELRTTLAALLGALAPQGRLLIEVPQGGHSYLHLGGHRQDPHTLFFTGQALVEALSAVGAQILFQQAMSKVDSPRRAEAIYTPDAGVPFYGTQRGSLTVICAPATDT